MKSKEFEFYVKADLSEYSGKYIVIVEDKVVASGENAKEVWEEAKKKFPDKTPLLAKIPKEEALIFWEKEINSRVAWALIEEVPLLLGRTDIFNLFNICFKKNTKTEFTS